MRPLIFSGQFQENYLKNEYFPITTGKINAIGQFSEHFFMFICKYSWAWTEGKPKEVCNTSLIYIQLMSRGESFVQIVVDGGEGWL